MIELREATTDADLEAWVHVRHVVLPGERTSTVAEMRGFERPGRLLLLAYGDGELAGSGLADRSDTGQGALAPRVLPEHRGRGVGAALLERLTAHLVEQGYDVARALVDAAEEQAVRFALAHGYEEVDRQVEMVLDVPADVPAPPPFDGVRFATVAERPELLEQAYAVACQGYEDLKLATGSISVPLEDWLRDEASLPAGSFVALADGEIVGYAGLLEWPGEPTRSEHGLTVVRRDWRRRGLATALKQREVAWAARNGIGTLVTWTQRGNEALQGVNRRLGYVDASVSLTMARPIP